jgi:hypothetical protein
MLRKLGLSFLVLLSIAGAAAGAGVGLVVQSTLAQFKLTDADAAQVTSTILIDDKRDLSYDLPGQSRDLLKKVPPGARGQATRGLWLWSKAYLSSAAFTKRYAAARAEREPKLPAYTTTVDQELKEKLDQDAKELEAGMKTSLAMAQPGQKSELEAMFKQMAAMLRSPDTVRALRASIEMRRAMEKENFESEFKRWRTTFPADPQVVIARRLREFLATSATVDFDAQLVANGDRMIFAKPEFEQKPSEWKSYYRYGRESIGAAREVADAWLKEIGPK